MPYIDLAFPCEECGMPGRFTYYRNYLDRTCQDCRHKRAKELSKRIDRSSVPFKETKRKKHYMTMREYRERDAALLEAASEKKRRVTIQERVVKVALRVLKYSEVPRHDVKGQVRRELLRRSGGRCDICCRVLPFEEACIDHDHVTDIVRGVLCSSCNLGLGVFKDDPKNLLAALQYLQADNPITIGQLGDDLLLEYLNVHCRNRLEWTRDRLDAVRHEGIIDRQNGTAAPLQAIAQ